MYMRRIALLATTMMLTGCAGSGFYSYLGDTFTPPFGANPNAAHGNSETDAKIHSHDVQLPPPMLYAAGDISPAPPKPPPTTRERRSEPTRSLWRAWSARRSSAAARHWTC